MEGGANGPKWLQTLLILCEVKKTNCKQTMKRMYTVFSVVTSVK